MFYPTKLSVELALASLRIANKRESVTPQYNHVIIVSRPKKSLQVFLGRDRDASANSTDSNEISASLPYTQNDRLKTIKRQLLPIH